jgi:hypothetical protein
MRGPVAKELRSQFAKRLKQELPSFRPTKNKHVAPGDRLFGMEAAPGLSIFLSLQPASDYDEFTVEVSWSTDGEYPIQTWCDLPSKPSCKGKMRFRLCYFWTDEDEWFYVCPRPSEEHQQKYFIEGGTDYYPESVEEAVRRVPRLVDEVFRRIREHAVPYFQNLATDHGKKRGTNS